MIKITKQQLQNIILSCDTNNPRRELNYIHVNKDSIVSANTRAAIRIKHNDKSSPNFYIDKKVAQLAIKQKGAIHFILDKNSIYCTDIDDIAILSISSEIYDTGFVFPDIDRIFPLTFKKEIKFIEKAEIQGITIVNKITIDSKYIPTLVSGSVCFNSTNLPVVIKSNDNITEVVIMPMIGLLEEAVF